MPKVSVIIPVYNVEKYMRECLDSVVNQTLKDIEIICVNDSSPDNSLAILQEYAKKDERIKVIDLKENGGIGKARNIAFQEVTAPYVMYLDSDDYVDENIISILYDKIQTADCDISICEVNAFNDDIVNDDYVKNKQNYYSRFCKKEGFYKFNGDFVNERSSCWGKLYKKEIIDKYNICFPEKLINEDEAFHWEYMSVCKNVYHVSRQLYYRRMHSQSTMTLRDFQHHRVTDMFYVLKHIHKFFIQNKLLRKYKKQYINYYFNHKKMILNRCNDEEKRELTEKMLEFENVAKIDRLSFSEKIISVKNIDNEKILTILGLQIKLKGITK